MVRLLRLAPALALGFLVLAPGATASAYNVASSSSGAPLHWATGSASAVAFSLALDPGPAEVTSDAARPVAVTSAATWQAALGEGGITVAIASAPVAAAPHAADGVNTVRWIVDAADPDREVGLLGRTFVAYHTSTGELTDADVTLDAVDFTWTTHTGACGDEYDLQSAMTHEFGHAIGLAHAIGHPEATMFATGDACETLKRDLAPDDVAAVVELYAPPPAGGGCSSGGGSAGMGGVLLAGVLFGRRRRHAAAASASASGEPLVAAAAAIAVGMAVFAAPSAASAAQLRRLELDELASGAAIIVRGHVAITHTVRDPGLETDSTLVVDDCLAGSCPQTLVVRRHGGELGDDGLQVDGEAVLAAGDEVVLFVRTDRAGHARVLGGVQGAWRVESDAIVRDLGDHELATATGWQAGEREVIPLAALRARCRDRKPSP